jgi:hypothetical protein
MPTDDVDVPHSRHFTPSRSIEIIDIVSKQVDNAGEHALQIWPSAPIVCLSDAAVEDERNFDALCFNCRQSIAIDR